MLFPNKEFTGKNGISYTLRSPRSEDAEKMLSYLKTTASETEFGLSYPDEMNFTVEDERKFIENYLSDKGSIMITAFDGDELVGNASLCCVIDKAKTLHRATFGIAIVKKHWGQGLGKKILTELILVAKEAGYEFLELEVASDNHSAVNLYRQLGFQVYGERPSSLRLRSGNYYNEFLMILDLR